MPLAASAFRRFWPGRPRRHAAGEAEADTLEEVVVTAQKRTENLQDVPISIEVLDNTRLEQLHVVNLDDYVKYSPSIAYSRAEGQGGNGQPGTSHIYMRGVVSGANENHSGSQPSVGTYLDEQPVTTIDGTVDVHLYDIQRIEVLEGPQGTLYGASSEAGTVRIITNKPDPSKFSAGYDVQGNKVDSRRHGLGVEGFVNMPLSPIAASAWSAGISTMPATFPMCRVPRRSAASPTASVRSRPGPVSRPATGIPRRRRAPRMWLPVRRRAQ